MTTTIPSRQRQRFVLGTTAEYQLYLRNFLLTPATAKRLTHRDQLRGLRPGAVQVVVLNGGWTDDDSIPLKMAVDDWRIRWGGLGLEFVMEEELLGGIPARKVRLLRDYDKKMESVGSCFISQQVVKDWLMMLAPQDQELLLLAQNERKGAKSQG